MPVGRGGPVPDPGPRLVSPRPRPHWRSPGHVSPRPRPHGHSPGRVHLSPCPTLRFFKKTEVWDCGPPGELRLAWLSLRTSSKSGPVSNWRGLGPQALPGGPG